jgi:subtilisin family serine protease
LFRKRLMKKITSTPISIGILSVTIALLGCGGADKTVTSTEKQSVTLTRNVDPDPKFTPVDDAVPGQYIVTLVATAPAGGSAARVAGPKVASAIAVPIEMFDISATSQALTTQYGGTVDHNYTNAPMFSMNATEAQARAMSHDASVDIVEANYQGTAASIRTLPSNTSNPADLANGYWGLDVIDQRSLTRNNTYCSGKTGAGVHAYVVGTGVDITHSEFGNRGSYDYSFLPGYNVDSGNHETGVASVIGGNTYGVAPGVRIHSVKVLYGSGNENPKTTINQTSKALEWIRNNAQRPAVVNLSIQFKKEYTKSWGVVTGSNTKGLEAQVRSLVNAGITVVIAAGNRDIATNSGKTAPSNVGEAIVVGAVNSNGTRGGIWDANNPLAYKSNFGPEIDVWAPGTGLISAYPNNNAGLFSGTSIAAPVVTGVVAQYLEAHPNHTPAQVESWLRNNASGSIPNTSVLNTSTLNGSPNRFIYVDPQGNF